MTRQDRYTALESWIAETQRVLGLLEWTITVSRDASDVEAWADIAPHSQAATAELRLSADFWRQTPEKQREILSHEMVHLITCRADQTVEALEDALGSLAWATFEPQYENAAERSVDRLCRIILPLLPPLRLPKA